MWKTFCLLSLTLSTFSFPHRVSRAEPIRADAALAHRDDPSHRKETRGRSELRELSERGIYDDESSGELGRWRNNGEALEPKWRDGDTVPLLPFSQFSRYSGDKIDSEVDDDYGQRGSKYRDALRSRTTLPAYSDFGDYESVGDRRAYREHEETLTRKRNDRPFPTRSAINPGRTDVEILSFAENRDPTSTRYQGAFQVQGNNYEHELDDEEYLKPRPRKRRPPQNYEFALVENETSSEGESEGPGYRATNNPAESESKSARNAVELKSLLKMQQEEGLSLSELLQRRNLTLSDLLKGKADAINALRARDSGEGEDYVEEASGASSSSANAATEKSQRAIDAESANTKNSQKREELGISIVPINLNDLANNATGFAFGVRTAAHSEAETTGQSILAAPDPARTTTTPLPVATNSMEPSAAGKSSNGGEMKAESLDEDEIMEFSDFTDYKNGRSSVSPVWLMAKDQTDRSASDADEYRGSTLSIEQLLSPTERAKPRNFSEQTLTSEEDHAALSEYQNDAPTTHDSEHSARLEAAEDADRSLMREIESALDAVSRGLPTSRPGSSRHASEEDLLRNHQNVSATGRKSYDQIVSEVEPEARAEIFELFASGSAGKRLERLLKSRNMSLEELIALRQRGSSRVHLAEVSRIKGREGGSSLETTLPSREENLREPGQRVLINGEAITSTEDYQHRDYLPSEDDTERSQLNYKTEDEDSSQEIKERHHSVQIVDLLTTFGSLPFAKDIQREFAGVADKKLPRIDDVGVVFVGDERETLRSNDTSNEIRSGHVKEVAKQEPSSIDIRTIYTQTSSAFDEDAKNEKGRSLSKVKPSIIASGAILGVTIVVFLAIFIVCRIRQKQKYRYRNTFSRAVFQGPMLAARKLSNSSSLSTVMVNVIATSTTRRPEKNDIQEAGDGDHRSDMENDSLDANDSWETIPDYMK